MGRLAQLKETSDFVGVKLMPNEEDKVNTFLSIIKDLVVKKHDHYPNSLFYVKNDVVYVELNTNSKTLHCDYFHIWNVFETEYSMHYTDIQLFIKSMVEQHMKLKDITPHGYFLQSVLDGNTS